jgi:hypothetical protein
MRRSRKLKVLKEKLRVTEDRWVDDTGTMMVRAETLEDRIEELEADARTRGAMLDEVVPALQDRADRLSAMLKEAEGDRDRLWWLVKGFAGAVDTGRNEPLRTWRNEAQIALEDSALLARLEEG